MERHVDDQWQQLANAIVEKAVFDYRNALRGQGYNDKCAAYVRGECERFFRSEWFINLSGTDGELILERLKKEYENECNAHSGNA